ncbi:helix-turn-helix DNA binding protein [Gordonia phage RayTheFireFly]|nr:helix-turn-helix DNA binding protein [Gordonia phage RayTheFireFly]
MLPRMKAANQLVLGVASVLGAIVAALLVTSIQGALVTLLLTAGGGLLASAAVTWIYTPDKAEARVGDVREAAAAGLTIPEIAAASRLSEADVRRILAS